MKGISLPRHAKDDTECLDPHGWQVIHCNGFELFSCMIVAPKCFYFMQGCSFSPTWSMLSTVCNMQPACLDHLHMHSSDDGDNAISGAERFQCLAESGKRVIFRSILVNHVNTYILHTVIDIFHLLMSATKDYCRTLKHVSLTLTTSALIGRESRVCLWWCSPRENVLGFCPLGVRTWKASRPAF